MIAETETQIYEKNKKRTKNIWGTKKLYILLAGLLYFQQLLVVLVDLSFKTYITCKMCDCYPYNQIEYKTKNKYEDNKQKNASKLNIGSNGQAKNK